MCSTQHNMYTCCNVTYVCWPQHTYIHALNVWTSSLHEFPRLVQTKHFAVDNVKVLSYVTHVHTCICKYTCIVYICTELLYIHLTTLELPRGNVQNPLCSLETHVDISTHIQWIRVYIIIMFTYTTFSN